MPESVSSSMGKEANEKGSVVIDEFHNQQLELVPEHEEAMKVLAEGGDHSPITPEEERRVLRKVDWMLMPIVSGRLQSDPVARLTVHQMAITFWLQVVDKGIFGTGALFGMATDTGLFFTEQIGGVAKTNTGRYSKASSIFYVVSEFLHNVRGTLAHLYCRGIC